MAQHVTLVYDGAKAITKSDTVNDPAGPFAAFYTGEGGDIKVTTINGDDITFKSTPAGVIVPIPIRRIWNSVTAAATPLGLKEAGYKGPPATT
jgi:hypothetical protein